MYFKFSLRKNPATNQTESYFRLVESYRNEFGRVCHRTLLNIGFIDYEIETLNIIRQILQDRLQRKAPLFEITDQIAIKWADIYWDKLIKTNKVDASYHAFEKSKRLVDIDSIKHKDAREIGAEWMCFQALEQLELNRKFVGVPPTSRMRLVRDPKLIFDLFNLTVLITNLLVKVP